MDFFLGSFCVTKVWRMRLRQLKTAVLHLKLFCPSFLYPHEKERNLKSTLMHRTVCDTWYRIKFSLRKSKLILSFFYFITWMVLKIKYELQRNGILLPKLFWPTVRKKFSAFSLEFQKFFSITRTIYSNSKKVRTMFGNRMLF